MSKKIIFFLYIYKMVNITKEMYESNGPEVITDNLSTVWFNQSHVQKQLGQKFISSYKQIQQRIQKKQI